MSDDLKKEIYKKYNHYVAENYNEKYIYRLIIQDGYSQEDVHEVIKEINTEKQEILKKKNKYRSIISIVLYIVGTILLCLGLGLIIIGGRLGFALIVLAVLTWIKANK